MVEGHGGREGGEGRVGGVEMRSEWWVMVGEGQTIYGGSAGCKVRYDTISLIAPAGPCQRLGDIMATQQPQKHGLANSQLKALLALYR